MFRVIRFSTVILLSLKTLIVIADVNSYSQCLNSPSASKWRPVYIQFSTSQLSQKKKCEDLTKTECGQYPEAKEKCKCLCDELNNSGKEKYNDDKPQQNNNNNQDNSKNNNNNNNDNSGKKGSKGSGKHGGSCFLGEDFVETNFGRIEMKNLVKNPNAKVLTYNKRTQQFEFSKVKYWLHADPSASAKYIILSTEYAPNLHITEEHLIYITSGESADDKFEIVRAEKLQIGDFLWINTVANNTNSGENFIKAKIMKIDKEIKTGIYAPVTENGNIFVNNVLASCYITVENEEVQKILFDFVMPIGKFIDYVVPNFLKKLFMDTLEFGDMVPIPKAALSLLDLSKVFVK